MRDDLETTDAEAEVVDVDEVVNEEVVVATDETVAAVEENVQVILPERLTEDRLERKLFEPDAYSNVTGCDPDTLVFNTDLCQDEYGTTLRGFLPVLRFMMLGLWLKGYCFGNLRPLIELFRLCVEGPQDAVTALGLIKDRVLWKLDYNAREMEKPEDKRWIKWLTPIEEICRLVVVEQEMDVETALEQFNVTPRTINDLDDGYTFSAAEVRQLVYVTDDNPQDALRDPDDNPFAAVVACQLMPAHELNDIPLDERTIEAAIKRKEDSNEPFVCSCYVVGSSPDHDCLVFQAAQGRVFYQRADERLHHWKNDSSKRDFPYLLEPTIENDGRSNLGQLRLMAAAARAAELARDVFTLQDLDRDRGGSYYLPPRGMKIRDYRLLKEECKRDGKRPPRYGPRLRPERCVSLEVAEAMVAKRAGRNERREERSNRLANVFQLPQSEEGGKRSKKRRGSLRGGLDN